MQNADCILFMGSNMAEAHPVGFRFPMMARERGAKLIHVDPHFTRTSAMCNQYVPIRAGTDIAFLGGLIRYVLAEERLFRVYVLAYSNAATIVNEGFKDTEDLDGLFCGFSADRNQYDPGHSCWNYEGEPSGFVRTHTPPQIKSESFSERLGFIQNPVPPSDSTLQHPRCVLNI